jgi:putative ABC transport system permease protein
MTVDGVVSDVALVGPSPKNRDLQFYTPPPRGITLAQASGIMVRLDAGVDESRTLATLRGVVKSVDNHALVTEARSERSILDDNLASPRFSTWLMDLFAAMALLLAVIGLYGIVSFAVGQRTREIGVRMALGARASDVSRFVVRDGLRLTVVGLAIGLTISFGATRLLSALLFGVSPTDPIVFFAITGVIIAATLLASYLPARRAARVDPVIALRAE